MKVIYIAGPYKGENAWEVECNVHHAEEAALMVTELGAIPLCPHTMYRFFQGTKTDSYWSDALVELARRSDAILLVKGWRKFNRPPQEQTKVEKLGKPVFFQHEWDDLEKWVKSSSRGAN